MTSKIQSLDIIEIETVNYTLANNLNAINNWVSKRFYFWWFKIFAVRMCKSFNLQYTIVGNSIWIEHSGFKIIIDYDTKEITTENSIRKTFGIVIPCGCFPFVMYFDDGVRFVTLDSLSDNIIGVYRSTFSDNEIFVLRAINHIVAPDLYETLSGRKSAINMQSEQSGDPGANYAYFVFSLLGVDFPDSFVDNGADVNMFYDEKYGFKKVE